MNELFNNKLNNPFEFDLFNSTCADIYDGLTYLTGQRDPLSSEKRKNSSIPQKILTAFAPYYEKQIDLLGWTVSLIKSGASAINLSLHGSILANNVAKEQLNHSGLSSWGSFASKAIVIISFPLTVFFFVLNAIEGVIQMVSLARLNQLVKQIDAPETSDLQKLQWIHQKYFTLTEGETKRIQTYINAHFFHLSRKEKSTKFEEIASKALEIKSALLEHRLSPKLAEVIKNELAHIELKINSSCKSDREEGEKRAKLLNETILNQAKNMIIVHLLAFGATTLGLVSGLLVFIGSATPIGLLVISAIAVSLFAIQYFVNRQLVQKEHIEFYKRLEAQGIKPLL